MLSEFVQNLRQRIGNREIFIIVSVIVLLSLVSAGSSPTDWHRGLENKSIAIFISRTDWCEDKFESIYYDLLDRTQANLVVTSTVSTPPVRRDRAGRSIPYTRISDLSPSDFDAAIFIGGEGIQQHYEDSDIISFIREMAHEDRVIASIGSGSALIADAGVARDVTMVTAEYTADKVAREGVSLADKRLYIDDIFITADAGKEREFVREFVPFVEDLRSDE